MSSTYRGADMLRGPLLPTFFRYSVPWAVAMLLMSSAGIVDGFFIGRHVGPIALAALNIVTPLFSLLMGLGIVLAAGGGVRCAYYRGQGREDAANAMFTKTMLALLLVSLVLTGMCAFWLEELVRLLGADKELLPLALSYVWVILPFFPVFLLELGLAYFVRVDERPLLASLGLMGSAVGNIILDYFFIARWGFGIAGAAWATGLSYALMLTLLTLTHLVWNKRPHLRLVRALGRWREVGQAAWNGISEMINEFSSGTVVLLINIIMMQRVGAYGVAAFTVINYVNWFCLMLAYGFSDSLGPLVSANHGAGQGPRARNFMRCAVVTVTMLGAACFALVTVWPRELVDIFLPGENPATALALDFMTLSRFMFLFCGVNIVLTAYFTGLLQAAASAVVATLRSLALPVLLLLTLPPLLGDRGIFVALPLAEVLTLGVALWLYRKVGGAGRPGRA